MLQGAAVAFGGAAFLDGEGGFRREASRSGGSFAGGAAFGCFFVELLRFGSRAAPRGQCEHLHLTPHAAGLPQREHVAGFDLVRGFCWLACQQHAPQSHFIGGEGAGFVKARRPEPLVQALAFGRGGHGINVGWRETFLTI